MNETSPLRITNYLVSILVIFVGTVFSFTTESILPFLIGFTGAALIITIYMNNTWDSRERISYFKNSLKEIKKNYCPHCGSYSPWWSEYCVNCGKELETEKIECQNCYSLNPSLSTYCGVCGKELGIKEQEEDEQEEEQEKKQTKQNKETREKIQECPECGYDFSLNVRKCPWCGYRIKK
ncbi:hypothetical protein C9439_05490 [archaeon SCG-AAA382B04]|nr:hypothetical protein C9439_05490 [archaeon SCG-AAA382B04]